MIIDEVIVACNVLDLSYKNLRMFDILRDNGFTPDDISSDLISIIENRNDSLLRLRSLEIELSDLALASGADFTKEDFYDEVNNIIFNIVYRLKQINIRGRSLKSIHFSEPNDLFFIFR